MSEDTSEASLISVLQRAHLFDETLPASCAPALSTLAALSALRRQKRDRSERATEAVGLYQRLLEQVQGLVGETPPQHKRGSAEFKRVFTEAVLLWTQLAKAGSSPLIDTVGADTLSDFPLDLPLEAAHEVQRAAEKFLGADTAQFEQLRARVRHLTSNLELKGRIARALVEHVREHDLLSPAGRVRLMGEFYEPVAWRPGDVDIAITSANLFFLVPRRKNDLETADWAQRSEEERRSVRDFFARVDAGNVAETERFPAFGLLQPEHLSSSLVADLARRTDVDADVVRSTLQTMFSLVPTRLHSQYLVHDTWGHVWQEAISDFELEYEWLGRISEPLSVATWGCVERKGPAPLLAAFVVTDAGVKLDETLFAAALFDEVLQRWRVGLSMAFSEVLADFMESKYSRMRPQKPLPTSSLVPSWSLKVDLSLVDLDRQMQRVAKPFLALATDSEAERLLRESLEAAGVPATGSSSAVAAAAELVRTRLAPRLAAGLDGINVDGQPVVSTLFRRTLLQLALLMAELERALSWTEKGAPSWTKPRTCPDLFVIAMAHFYEHDRVENFWHLDEIARSEFDAACHTLELALATNREETKP